MTGTSTGDDFTTLDHTYFQVTPSVYLIPYAPSRSLYQRKSMASSSSSTSWIYDAFINFRRLDMPISFVSDLYAALVDARINTFIHDKLEKETELEPELVQAIQGSQISIVIFSTNYASSRLCLDELVKIMECHRTYGQIVVPIFYGVDPSDVRYLKGTFGVGLESLAQRCLLEGRHDVLRSWKRALKEATNLAGSDAMNWNWSSEGGLVNKIVHDIFERRDMDLMSIPKFPVGLESHAQPVIEFIENHSDRGCAVGISGMGGVGKTTLAKFIYNKIHKRFTRRYFLENIRQVFETSKRGFIDLQEQLLSGVLKRRVEIDSITTGVTMMKMSCGEETLIVLDDVFNFEEFEALYGNRIFIGPGSVIIVTTRKESLLKMLNVDFVYHMMQMTQEESFELLKWHAFRRAKPRGEDFYELVERVVASCRGIPLYLEVIGSYSSEMSKEAWEHVLEKLERIRRIPNSEPRRDILKISFDGLRTEMEKVIFLDICCYFIGKDRAFVTDILNEGGQSADIAITALIERNLLKVEKNNTLAMHDLLQAMGRDVVRSSSSNPEWIYDVFLNFRGEDVRNNFVSHLYAALTNAQINTFIDDKLDKGTELTSELVRAIQGSRISIVILSSDYASSRWCLNELVKIMECSRTYSQVVVPVFYDVDPSDVRQQTGAFGERLEATSKKSLLKGTLNELNSWKSALMQVANLAGWDARNRSESSLVDRIVEDIFQRLDMDLLPITEFPVGLESRVQPMIKFIEDHSGKGCVVGIWGMGGVGKTTLAKFIYNRIRRRFSHRSFIENIRVVCETNSRGCIDLQEQLLSNVLKRKFKIDNVELGITIIEKRLSLVQTLIVLDDVTEFEQLKAICGNQKWIDGGSAIIITTRDVRLLNMLKVNYVYKMEEMDKNESLELFSWHAFRKAKPREDFNELATNVVAYCGGLPLALQVIGSYLLERTKKEWECVLSKLEIIPDDQVQKKLRISFDGLRDQMERDIFLDICCFFIGKDRAYVTEILNGCGLHADIGITVLIERSLIKVEKNNKLGMHHLLRDMGREIICESSRKEPGKRSRLWLQEDVRDVLRNNTGTEAIEGLALKSHFTSRDCFEAYAFDKMKRLKLLQLDYVRLTGVYGSLSKQLRWICWEGFPSRFIHDNFYLEGLIAMDLKRSNLRVVWKTPQVLQHLKFLNLSHSMYLKETPNFSGLPSLEKLILKDCPCLRKIHQSIGDLQNLLLINLKDCTSLSNLPKEMYKLKSLKILILSGCLQIDKLEEDIVQMESLTTLIAENTAVKEVPFSIVSSKSIGYISLCGYKGLSHKVFPSIILSWMSPTMNPLSYIQPFCGVPVSTVSMDFQNNNFGDLASMHRSLSHLRSVLVQCDMKFLSEQVCTILDDVFGVNFTELEITSYTSQNLHHYMSSKIVYLRSYLIGVGSYREVFSTLSDSISKGLATSETSDVFLPGDNYPYWLAHVGEGHSVCFMVPERCRMKGMTLCVVYLSNPENMATESLTGVLIVNHTRCTMQVYKRDTVISFNDADWQGIISHLGVGDKVEIFVTFGHGLVVKKTAVYVMCDESIDVEMEPSPEPKKEPQKNPLARFGKKKLIVAFGVFLFLSFRSLTSKRNSLSHS